MLPVNRFEANNLIFLGDWFEASSAVLSKPRAQDCSDKIEKD